MEEKTTARQSRLKEVLREGVQVIMMVVFKHLRTFIAAKYPDEKQDFHAMLTGAVINALFGQENREEKFQTFKNENKAIVEQELLTFAASNSEMCDNITDALRVQVLCDSLEGENNEHILQRADELGILVKDRAIPLPTTFMTRVRTLGEENGLIIAPAPDVS